MTEKTTSNRRRSGDRRRKPTPPISRYTFRGRRVHARRAGEDRNYYVDRYESRYLFIILGVLLLSILDAYLTLNLLRHGGIELNPIMNLLIRHDPVLFLCIKFGITGLGITFLLIHKNFHLFGHFPVARVIYLVFLGYLFLIAYEMMLYSSRIHP